MPLDSQALPSRPDILVMGPYPAWDMERLEADYELHRFWEATDRPHFLAARADRIRGIATAGNIGAGAEVIAALPKLEIISVYGVGTDAVDLSAASARGIRVTNTPDVLTGDVADLAVGMLLALARGIVEGDAHVRSGAWSRGPMPLGTRIHGKRAGIVGLGRIGAATARRLAGFDMEIGYFGRTEKPEAPYRFFASLTDLADWCDVLVVTLSAGADSLGMIDAKVLAALGPSGLLVNVSRGTTVDEEALIAALEQRTIAGAALDVFMNEPNIDARFRALPNALLQPHHASGTVETRKAMGRLMRENLAAHFAGTPLLTPVV